MVETNTGAIEQSAIEYVTEGRDWLVVERLRLFRLKRAIDAYACTVDSELQDCVEAGRELGAEIDLPIWENVWRTAPAAANQRGCGSFRTAPQPRCDGRHGAKRGLMLRLLNEAGRLGVSKMSYHQRPHELRLAISTEAEALISDFGGEAYAEACRRAKEASNDSLARDWTIVAAMIARRSGWRSSVLDALFG
jgi:hypothetical protein